MADDPEFHRSAWVNVRDRARRGWESHRDEPWEDFEEAVRFGWRTVQTAQRREDEFEQSGRWTY